MPRAAAIMMAAHEFSNRKKAASWVMYTPNEWRGPPKNSPTTAPIKLNVLQTLSAPNRYGSALGRRTLSNTCHSSVAYERINSKADGSTWVSPRIILIIIGKNVMIATIIIFESWVVRPNQLFMIGAKAMMGTELAAIAKGSNTSRAAVQRTVVSATRIPALQPITSPPTASVAV